MKRLPSLEHACRRQRGATLVEFVIVFPLAVLLVLSLIQFGMVYMMKLELNHATFMAARAGAMHNASLPVIRDNLLRGLSHAYQDQLQTSDANRLLGGAASVKVRALDPTLVKITRINPSPAAFKDFGVTDPMKKITYIPNDNLEFRSTANGATSKMNLRDANLLKIKVVYGYHLTVPVVGRMLARIMCSGDIGVTAWGGEISVLKSKYLPTSTQCLEYWKTPLDKFPRIPLEAYAIVDMQSPAYKN